MLLWSSSTFTKLVGSGFVMLMLSFVARSRIQYWPSVPQKSALVASGETLKPPPPPPAGRFFHSIFFSPVLRSTM